MGGWVVILNLIFIVFQWHGVHQLLLSRQAVLCWRVCLRVRLAALPGRGATSQMTSERADVITTPPFSTDEFAVVTWHSKYASDWLLGSCYYVTLSSIYIDRIVSEDYTVDDAAHNMRVCRHSVWMRVHMHGGWDWWRHRCCHAWCEHNMVDARPLVERILRWRHS